MVFADGSPSCATSYVYDGTFRGQRGLGQGPSLAIGDGALGFWKAMRQVYGETRRQRCWVHKTANVLNYLSKGKQKQAKQHLHAI